MSRREDARDIVDIEYDEILHDTGRAILFMVDGTKVSIGYNAPLENLEEIQEKLAAGDTEKGEIQVPKWLAVDNGWMEWDDD